MCSKVAVENFIVETAQWCARAVHRVRSTRSLSSEERQTALTLLTKHLTHLRRTNSSLDWLEEQGGSAIEWERRLNELYYKQLSLNDKIHIYELKPYPLASPDTETPTKAWFTVQDYSMYPQLLPGDHLLIAPIDREDYLKTTGIVALAYRYDKTQPRTWIAGRAEPVANRFVRLTRDNQKTYGHLDKIIPLRHIVFMYRVEKLERQFKTNA